MNSILKSTGFYHNDSDKIFNSYTEYIEWYYNYKKINSSVNQKKFKAGIFFSRSLIVKNNLEGINALVTELEKNNIIPVPLFSTQKEHSQIPCSGYNIDLKQLYSVDVIINCVSSFLFQKDIGKSSDKTVLDEINVPVFQAVCSSGRTEKEWFENPQGITPLNQIYWIAQPEFNGTIEPAVIFARDPQSNGEYPRQLPIYERIKFFVTRINNWLKLSELPLEKRRVTILLHNNPCHGTEASLGGANGLDTFESLLKIMNNLYSNGYDIINIPSSSKELSDEFINKKAVSEFRWTTVDEIISKGGAIALIDENKYSDYFNELSELNRKKMIEAWENPPGKGMVYKNNLVVSGLKFGNLNIIAEPKRGCYGARCDGEVCKILHNPDIPPTHQCYAVFKWVQENSDIIISLGTHGYIEFLPGKSSGMSSDCFPEIITGPVPHIYIYTSKNPNEAIIAKRRASAVITDHIIPCMENYEIVPEILNLEELLIQYNNCSMLNEDSRKKLLFDEIKNISIKEKIISDKNYDNENDLISDVHNKIFSLQESAINNGLHILSNVYDIEKTAKMILTILKYDSSLPSLRRIILEIRGYDYDTIMKNPDIFFESKTGGQLLKEAEETALNIIKYVLSNQNINEDFIAEQLNSEKYSVSNIKKLYDLIFIIMNEIYPNLMKTVDEIPQVLNAMNKRYISPGPGGALTRGKINIIPTGRNIFSIDPQKIPTKQAYKIGMKLADEILKKHISEDNKYPEKIGMVLWSIDAFRADGEQLSQILYLLGARPVWNEAGIVSDIEIIPLEELKRPRIDVTVRTSEIFRDTLPNLIELLDNAIEKISMLNESEEDNFIIKNINDYKKNALEKNINLDDAALERAARFRIFAAKPGAYGNGIKLMIAASAWRTINDLGETFIENGSYAYGSGIFGKDSYNEFIHNLKNIKTVFHKIESDESDPLGCCYNDFHGGMTAAVRTLSNEIPKVLWGNTKDPSNPRVTELREEIERVVKVKLLNPKWIEGMKKHGYKGAQDMAHKATSVYGWDATSDVVDDWVFDELTKKYILDAEMRDFFEKNNPWAMEELARRFLEAEERGLWKADPEVLKELKNQYLQIEGIMEEHLISYGSDFQGGNIDIITKKDLVKK